MPTNDEPRQNKSHPYFKLAKDQKDQHADAGPSDHPAPLPTPGDRLAPAELEAERDPAAETPNDHSGNKS